MTLPQITSVNCQCSYPADSVMSKDRLNLYFTEGGPPNVTRDLTLGDGALLYIAYVILIWAPLIPATRWSCSQSPADSNDCWLQLHLVAGIRGAQISITGLQACQTSADFWNIWGHFCGSARSNEKIFCPLEVGVGVGGGGLYFLRNFGLEMENYVIFCWNVLCFVEVETHIFTLFNMW